MQKNSLIPHEDISVLALRLYRKNEKYDTMIHEWDLLTRGSTPKIKTPSNLSAPHSAHSPSLTPLLLPTISLYPSAAMPPKKSKKDADVSDDKFMRAARFGRVKNDLRMGFVVSISRCCKSYCIIFLNSFMYRASPMLASQPSPTSSPAHVMQKPPIT